MSSVERLQELILSVKNAYGSLEQPSHSFMEKRYKSLICHPFVSDVLSRYFIKNDTDLNDHASLHLHILHDDGSMMLCLSFVDNWAMLFRLEKQNPIYSSVLDTSSLHLAGAECEVMKLLNQYGFKLVSREEAAVPIDMNLFNTDRSDVRLYHAIVADDGIVPKVLQD
jgi:hypothetical protein